MQHVPSIQQTPLHVQDQLPQHWPMQSRGPQNFRLHRRKHTPHISMIQYGPRAIGDRAAPLFTSLGIGIGMLKRAFSGTDALPPTPNRALFIIVNIARMPSCGSPINQPVAPSYCMTLLGIREGPFYVQAHNL